MRAAERWPLRAVAPPHAAALRRPRAPRTRGPAHTGALQHEPTHDQRSASTPNRQYSGRTSRRRFSGRPVPGPRLVASIPARILPHMNANRSPLRVNVPSRASMVAPLLLAAVGLLAGPLLTACDGSAGGRDPGLGHPRIRVHRRADLRDHELPTDRVCGGRGDADGGVARLHGGRGERWPSHRGVRDAARWDRIHRQHTRVGHQLGRHLRPLHRDPRRCGALCPRAARARWTTRW
jgi:hypothetical protein